MTMMKLWQVLGNSKVARRVLHSEWQQHCRCRSMKSRAVSTSDSSPAGPVLTFLSPSPTYSRSAVQFLKELFHLPPINAKIKTRGTRTRDSLDQLHFGSSSSSWDSIACACPASGTILHFLSFSADRSRETKSVHGGLRLIAVQGSNFASASSTISSQFSEEQCSDVLVECRQQLAGSIRKRQIFSQSADKTGLAAAASTLEARLRGLLIYLICDVMGRQLHPSWILERNPSTTRPVSPLLEFMTLLSNKKSLKCGKKSIDSTGSNIPDDVGKLRELALPFFPGVSSLPSKLSKSSLLRPLPGLYQFSVGRKENQSKTRRNIIVNPGLIIRPLPAAREDLRTSPPSLVFQCESLTGAQKLVEERLGGITEKIGWRGHGQSGSLIVSHPSILGLDIRIGEGAGAEWKLEGMFAEAQESLLAGSLAELQSTHVVSEGKRDITSTTVQDPKNLNEDCWVEFRSNVRHPLGFFKQFTSFLFDKPVRTKVAKPPDIPYE